MGKFKVPIEEGKIHFGKEYLDSFNPNVSWRADSRIKFILKWWQKWHAFRKDYKPIQCCLPSKIKGKLKKKNTGFASDILFLGLKVVIVCVLSHVWLFCDPMNCSLPGSSDHGIFQARILQWVAISSTRGSSWPGIEPRSPALQADSLPFETGSTITKKGVMSIKFVL